MSTRSLKAVRRTAALAAFLLALVPACNLDSSRSGQAGYGDERGTNGQREQTSAVSSSNLKSIRVPVSNRPPTSIREEDTIGL